MSECASHKLIGNVRERWKELGNDDPDRVAERYRGDPWRLFYNGWIEGRAEFLAASRKDSELIQALLDGLHSVASLADVDADERSTIARDPIAAAKAAGFTPTTP